jgi:hypothetical protein
VAGQLKLRRRWRGHLPCSITAQRPPAGRCASSTVPASCRGTRACRRSGQLCMCNLSSHPVDPGDSGPSRRVAFAEGTAGVGDLALKRLPGTYRRHGESPAFAGDLRRGVQVRVKCESRGPTRCHLSNWPERQQRRSPPCPTSLSITR